MTFEQIFANCVATPKPDKSKLTYKEIDKNELAEVMTLSQTLGISFEETSICLVIKSIDNITHYVVRFQNRKIFLAKFEIIGYKTFYFNYRGKS